ncbi:MAG: BrnT family toxin [Kiritimatiellales bacterium]
MRDLLGQIEGFDWDAGNSDKNWLKHSVSIKECEEIFFNEPLIVLEDLKHSMLEQRFAAYGITKDGRTLHVIFTSRNKKIRVISARDMHRKERIFYENKN